MVVGHERRFKTTNHAISPVSTVKNKLVMIELEVIRRLLFAVLLIYRDTSIAAKIGITRRITNATEHRVATNQPCVTVGYRPLLAVAR